MTRRSPRLRLWLGLVALLAGGACCGAGCFALWMSRAQNARVAALAVGRDVAVGASAPDVVLLARGRWLIARGLLEPAQVIADRMTADRSAILRAELLYALGNAQLRRGLLLIRTVPYRKAAPVLRQARAQYREALRLDPGDWDARYNYALVDALLRDAEPGTPVSGEQMSHALAIWPDIPGAPNGMP